MKSSKMFIIYFVYEIPSQGLLGLNPTKSDQVRPNPTKSDQIRPNPTKSDRIRPNPVGVASGRGPYLWKEMLGSYYNRTEAQVSGWVQQTSKIRWLLFFKSHANIFLLRGCGSDQSTWEAVVHGRCDVCSGCLLCLHIAVCEPCVPKGVG